jgi:hypothetical protein
MLNAARALRRTGLVEASWSPEPLSPGDIGRRAPSNWVRVNPAKGVPPHCPDYTAVFCTMPKPEAQPAITSAARLFATSPGLVAKIRKLAAPSQKVTLWRPAISQRVWEVLKPGTGLNTKPRVLWIDEGIAPVWLTDLINETLGIAAWIVVERPGATYSGAVARIPKQNDEYGWARELAAVGPQILVRPAGADASADHYKMLMAAAAGCHLLVDNRLDIPASLGAVRLPGKLSSWQRSLRNAVSDLTGTLKSGQRTRAATLALPSVESAPPPWADSTAEMTETLLQSAAE